MIFLITLHFPMIFSKLLKRKIVVYKGGTLAKERKGRLFSVLYHVIFDQFSYMISDIVIVESKSSITFQNLKKYAYKAVIGSLYVDEQFFYCKKNLKERNNKIGFFGTLSESKGVDKLCEALIRIRDYLEEKDVEVVIGGDGPLYNYIKEMIDKNDLHDRINVVGWVQHEKIPDYLNEIKLLILPSISEGLPNIILEAMACRTPVLATPVGAIPDIIKDGKTGFILEKNTPEYISKNIIRVLECPKLEEITNNAYRLFKRRFTYDAALNRYIRIFRKLLQERK